MKQTALVLLLLLAGTGGALAVDPFLGVAVYYLFAVLRPQYIWDWALMIDIRWSFYVAIAILFATIIYLPRFRHEKIFSVGHAVMLGFAIWVTLSHIFALNSEVSWHWYWEYLKIFIIFFCASFVIREFNQIRVLYLIAAIALGYIAWEMNSLYLFSGRLDIFKHGYGGLDNNGAGLIMAMGVPLAYFLWQGYSRWWRWIFLALVPLMVHATLMSYSRGAMVSLLLASPLLILRSPRKVAMAWSLAGLVLLLPILAGPEIQAEFFSIQEYEKDTPAQSRFDSWKAAWRIANDYPMAGVGVRNANLLSYEYGADSPGRTIHSQYLQIAADSGMPALALYLLVLFVTWRKVRGVQKQLRKSTLEEHQLAYAMAVFCIGAAFLSLEVFELPYLLILLALKLPLTMRQEEKAPDASHSPVSSFAAEVT